MFAVVPQLRLATPVVAQCPATQSPLQQSDGALQASLVAPHVGVAEHLPLTQERPPQQSPEVAQRLPAAPHHPRQLFVPVGAAAQYGDESQQPAPPVPHASPLQLFPVAGSQNPPLQERPPQQSLVAVQDQPSDPQTGRQILPGCFPTPMQFGAESQQPPPAAPALQAEPEHAVPPGTHMPSELSLIHI